MKNLAYRAIGELSERYDPEFMILYGSVARGDYTEGSDIDVAVFCECPITSHDVSFFEGMQFDCWIYAVLEADAQKAAFLRLAGGELFCDKTGAGKEFLDCINAKFEAGPEPITTHSREHLVEWCKKMLSRANGSDIEARYRRTELPCMLVEMYFKLRNRWFAGSKSSFDWIRKNDTEAYMIFEEAFSDPTNMNVLTSLVEVVTNIELQTPVTRDKIN